VVNLFDVLIHAGRTETTFTFDLWIVQPEPHRNRDAQQTA
jgi:hypothetical protein